MERNRVARSRACCFTSVGSGTKSAKNGGRRSRGSRGADIIRHPLSRPILPRKAMVPQVSQPIFGQGHHSDRMRFALSGGPASYRPTARAGVGGKSPIALDTRPATRKKGLEIMSELSLTDAVIQAVVFADGLIRHYDWYDTPALRSLVRTELEALDRSIRAGNALVERAEEFRNLYRRIPRRVGGESAPSFHELGRKLAMRVFQGIVSAAWNAEVREAAVRNAEHLNIRCRPKQLDQCYGPEQFDAIMERWPAVQVYLRDEALRFDSNRLVANIQDEAAKAAQRLKLRASIGGQPGGDGNGNGKGKRKAPINARMIDTLQKQPEAKDWTIEQWMQHLGCKSKASVAKTKCWETIMGARAVRKVQRLQQDQKRTR